MAQKIVAIVGSYRKGGATDSAVQAILAGAREHGAHTHAIYLTDRHLEFCTNCRRCTQAPGLQRGCCVQQDDLESILTEIDAADALVLGAPVNYWNATAIFRQFTERLLGPPTGPGDRARPGCATNTSPAKLCWSARLPCPASAFPSSPGPRASCASPPGFWARPVARLWIGLTGKQPHQPLSPRALARARRIGLTLA